jgi:hypothetical protein
MNLVVYCADIGSVPKGRFGWARRDGRQTAAGRHCEGTEIAELVDAASADLSEGRPVALGFECPLYVPVPTQELRLGKARLGEGNRSWSAGAGAGALATGLVEVAWILEGIRRSVPEVPAHINWDAFRVAERGLFLWEAFVTDRAKGDTHVDDASVAVEAFWRDLPDVAAANAVTGERPFSLLGAALLWSGWSQDIDLLTLPCLVIKAAYSAAVHNELISDPALASRGTT